MRFEESKLTLFCVFSLVDMYTNSLSEEFSQKSVFKDMFLVWDIFENTSCKNMTAFCR